MKQHGRVLFRRPFLKSIAAISLLSVSSANAQSERGVYVESDTEIVKLGNSRIELLFHAPSGRFRQFRDKNQQIKLRDIENAPYSPTFGLSFEHPEFGDTGTSGAHAQETTIEQTINDDHATLSIEYRDLQLWDDTGRVDQRFRGPITITVTVKEGDSLSYWSASVTNETGATVRELAVPLITDIQSIAQNETDALIVPNQVGRRIPNPIENGGSTHRYPTGFGTMQFTAYLGESGGFYTDTRDTEGYSKSMRWQKANNEPYLNYSMNHRVPKKPGEDVTLPYQTTLGSIEGSWYDAVDRYRNWLEEDGWIASDVDTPPEWLQESAGSQRVVSYYDDQFQGEERTYEKSASLVEMGKRLLDTTVHLQWLGWETHGYPAPGDWFPPKEGLESFRNTINQLAEQGIRTIGFTSATLLKLSSDFAQKNPDEARSWAIKAPDGSARTFEEGHGIRFYEIEFTHPGVQKKLRQVLRRMVENGMTEVTLDGFPWSPVPDCHDADHDHPPGRGGNWFSTRAKQNLSEIKSSLRSIDSEVAISGEGISDFYISEMDIFQTRDVMAEDADGPESKLNGTPAEIIPIFQYAFSDLIVTRTKNHSPYNGEWNDATKLRLFTARALKWGAAQMFALFRPPDEDPMTRKTLDYLRRVMEARETYAKRFQAKGRMIRAPRFDTGSVTFETVDGTEYIRDQVHGSAWRSDADEVGLILTNIGDDRTTVDLDLDEQPMSLPLADDRLVYTVTNGVYDMISIQSDVVSIELASEDIVVLVFAPETEARRRTLEALIAAQEQVSETAASESTTHLTEAKRAFEAHDFELAMERVNRALEVMETATPTETTESPEESTPTENPNTDTSTPADTSTETITSTPPRTEEKNGVVTSTPTEIETTTSTTGADGPGFTVLSGIVALGIAAWRQIQETKKNS